jgi:hypothetical protein
MKLRIRGNTVRARLSQSEVMAFAEIGSIEEPTDFGNGQQLVFALSATDAQAPDATFIDGRIEISIPAETVTSWANSDQVEIAGETKTIKLLVEKDFKCLTPRPGDEDYDTFPHPRESASSC